MKIGYILGALLCLAAQAHAQELSPGPDPVCTTSVAGKCKPDGTSITVTGDGTISASASGAGAMLKDGSNATLPDARTNLGASVTGGVWPGSLGGTGVANTSKTITLGGNLVTSGAFATTITSTGTTDSTLPAGTHSLAPLDSPVFTSPSVAAGPLYPPASIQCGSLTGADFNSTADQAITISAPVAASFMVEAVIVTNASTSLTTAAGGVYTGAGKSGVTLVAATQIYTVLTGAAANSVGSALILTTATGATQTRMNGLTTIYLSLTTGQGAPATADVRVDCRPLL